MTLKEAAVGQSVKGFKAGRRRRCQTPHHGYGHHQRNPNLAQGRAGRPIEVTVRGYELSVRKADAENIIVETITE